MWGLLISLALSAIGTAMQSAGAAKAQRAMEDRTQAELDRQARIQKQAEEEYTKSLAQSQGDVAVQQVQQGSQEREQLYNQLQAVPQDTQAQQITQNPMEKLRDAAQMQVSNKTRAKLGGYETWVLDQAIKNARASQNLGIFTQQAGRSANVLPLEIQAASHAGDNLSGLGTVVSGLGSLFGGAGGVIGSLGSAGVQAESQRQQAARAQNGYGWIGGY